MIEASLALAGWAKDTQHTIDAICAAGIPSNIVELSFLDLNNILHYLASLQKFEANLLWYAKVGAKTGRELRSGTHMRFPFWFLRQKSGLQYYHRDRIRHNCASFILDILRAGDTQGCFSGFDESPYVVNALQETIRLNAASKGEIVRNEELAGAAAIKQLYKPLGWMGYGKAAITDWFDTTPAVLAEMVAYAAAKQSHQIHMEHSCSK